MLTSLFICFACFFLTTSTSHGDRLTVFSAATPDNTLKNLAGTTSPSLVLRLRNDLAGDAPEDFLAGWQLTLAIVPGLNSRGTLVFEDAIQPSTEYLFQDVSSFGVEVVATDDQLLAFDLLLPLNGGIEVPTGSGASMFEITFSSSQNAWGLFHLVALNGLGGSEWSDASEPIRRRREFENITDLQEPPTLGLITVLSHGDFELDGDVDGADFLSWQRGESPNLLSASELANWKQDFGPTLNSPTSAAFVPEPAMGGICFVAAICLLARRRRPGERACSACDVVVLWPVSCWHKLLSYSDLPSPESTKKSHLHKFITMIRSEFADFSAELEAKDAMTCIGA